ncbi:MAG: hypothetical protein HY549_11670 [Elusimicrobia bacterium]|nr:hypothetical protein [Elusimicrobiota bacterium]
MGPYPTYFAAIALGSGAATLLGAWAAGASLSVIAAAAVGSSLLAYGIARGASAPLEQIKAVLHRLREGQGGARVSEHLPKPWSGLAAAVNDLADRIEMDFAKLRDLERMRREFVANVSHELRTPLASIKAFAETLGQEGVSVCDQREFIAEIERNTDRMTRLVDDLLELSALESGNRPPQREPVSLMKVVAEVAAGLKPLADRKRIVLRTEPFHDTPELLADRGQVKQVLVNLVENAIKFTSEGGTIRVSPVVSEESVSVLVEDNGAGIPAGDLPRIFERFYRVDKARSREMGGTGLGLAIVKHIVEGHGGSVRVDSELGRGSIFRFSLPRTDERA